MTARTSPMSTTQCRQLSARRDTARRALTGLSQESARFCRLRAKLSSLGGLWPWQCFPTTAIVSERSKISLTFAFVNLVNRRMNMGTPIVPVQQHRRTMPNRRRTRGKHRLNPQFHRIFFSESAKTTQKDTAKSGSSQQRTSSAERSSSNSKKQAKSSQATKNKQERNRMKKMAAAAEKAHAQEH